MITFSGRIARAFAHTAAAATVVGSAVVALPTATAVEADGPHYQEPQVGQCRNYGYSAAMGSTAQTPVVACSSTHTAKVIAVVQLPSSMTWSTPLDDIVHAGAVKCEDAYFQAVGSTDLKRRMTALGEAIFVPTQAQRDHGARWIRCDVVVWGRSALVPLPNRTPILGDVRPYKITRCIVGTHLYVTACGLTHTYRATGDFHLSGTTYPGDAAVLRAAERHCPSLVSSRTWVWTGPDRARWRAGNHVVVCFTKTTH